MTWRVGMEAVCVNDDFHPQGSPRRAPLSGFPVLRGVYTVAGVEEHFSRPYLVLLELSQGDCWCAASFRPVKTTSIEIFTQMLAPKPTKKRAKERT